MRPRRRCGRGSGARTLAARLKAIYGSVDKVDAFVGMVAEPHVAGSELGQLQLAIWKRSSRRFATATASSTRTTRSWPRSSRRYGITYKHTLAELIKLNTGATVAQNVFIAVAEDAAPSPGSPSGGDGSGGGGHHSHRHQSAVPVDGKEAIG